MNSQQDDHIVGRIGPYRTICLCKIVDPTRETRRCHVRRFRKETLGVVDYHSEIDLASHLGTHVEVPYHYRDDLKDTASLPATSFLGRGVLLKLNTCSPRALITRVDLDAADRGRIGQGDIAVLDSPFQHQPFVPSPDDLRPQLSREAAEWFLEKQVKCVAFGHGIAIENDPQHCLAVHDILMPHDITFIEVMQNLDRLEQEIFLLVFLPLPIRGLDSSPTYVVAMEGVPGFCERSTLT
jgi:arylformamidase